MKLTDALEKLLKEHERQAKQAELWQDNAWKSNYYLYLNLVYDNLEKLDNADCR
ncbi:MAG: hypothetical protein PHQ43_10060 [Dehalococcoidales bacterium]|nr:hypothetical protein [Dehalococcoidales bacterium]